MSTKIPYLDETWSPVTGCSPCSPGCENCYAQRMVKRFPQLHASQPTVNTGGVMSNSFLFMWLVAGCPEAVILFNGVAYCGQGFGLVDPWHPLAFWMMCAG